MNIFPANRRLKLKECEIKAPEEKNKVSFLIPDQAQKPQEHGTFEVLAVSEDCEKPWSPGSKVVVPFHMVETINACEEEIKMVLENYVMCTIAD